jgi:hypothetical protein
MNKFQPGEEVYVRLTFGSAVPLKNVFVVFAHEEDENEQFSQWLFSSDENKPIDPALGSVDFSMRIERDKRPGVYVLDKIRFATFDGNTLDYQGDVGTPKFEVIPEREIAPTVHELSISTKGQWEDLRRREEW